MCCVNSGGNWNNGSNAGVWAVNLNNSRSNSNNNYGFRSDSLPFAPHAACTAWQRGSLRRALRRNVLHPRPLVMHSRRVAVRVKTGTGACP